MKEKPNDLRWTENFRANISIQNSAFSLKAADYIGIVGEPMERDASGKVTSIKPMIPDDESYLSRGKWMTGDYDLFQVLAYGDECEVVDQKSVTFSQIEEAINERLGWEAIQHGPQAQWASSQGKNHGQYNDFDMEHEVGEALKKRQYDRKIETIIGPMAFT